MAGNLWHEGVASSHTETNAGNNTSSLIETRTGSRSGDGSGTQASVKWHAVDMDVVGINANKISSITGAIDAYVTSIESHLDQINADAEQTNAFAGDDVRQAVKDYINQVKTYCKNLTSQLRAFNDKLVEINKTWELNRATLSKNISQAATFDAGEQYKSSTTPGTAPAGRLS